MRAGSGVESASLHPKQMANSGLCCYGTGADAQETKHVRVVGAPKLTYKISVLGDANMGKTTLIHRLVHGSLPEETSPTSGVGYSTYDCASVPCEIWDTAGQERFGALVPVYIRGTDLCLIAVCLTDTYEVRAAAVERWTRTLRAVSADAPILVIGTKADLASPDTLTPDVAMTTSSVSGLGVAELGATITATVLALASAR